jgi:hypothetical protein
MGSGGELGRTVGRLFQEDVVGMMIGTSGIFEDEGVGRGLVDGVEKPVGTLDGTLRCSVGPTIPGGPLVGVSSQPVARLSVCIKPGLSMLV